jgi:hypothetical protein
MNTELRKMIVDAECRHLNEAELAKIREYARGMGARLAAMRRVEDAEDRIIAQAADAFCAKNAAYVAKVPDARAKTARDMTLTLRYLAQAYVRQDMTFFRKNYAEWIGQLLKAIVASDVLVFGQLCLREAIDANLDAADAAELKPYLEVFIEELRA